MMRGAASNSRSPQQPSRIRRVVGKPASLIVVGMVALVFMSAFSFFADTEFMGAVNIVRSSPAQDNNPIPIPKTKTESATTIKTQATETNNQEKKCALLFFGLARSFKMLVLPSIQQHILKINPSCDVYAHTYEVEAEDHAPVYAQDVELLGENAKVIYDTDESFAKARNVTFYRQFAPGEWAKWKPNSIDNMIKQWHSIQSVWELMEASGIKYDQVGLFREDVMYMDDIDIYSGVAVVPSWGWNSGMNDRMFYGNYKYSEIWATEKFKQAPVFAATLDNQLHSEKYAKWLMRNAPVTKSSVCFRRVRSSGRVKEWDCKSPTETAAGNAAAGNEFTDGTGSDVDALVDIENVVDAAGDDTDVKTDVEDDNDSGADAYVDDTSESDGGTDADAETDTDADAETVVDATSDDLNGVDGATDVKTDVEDDNDSGADANAETDQDDTETDEDADAENEQNNELTTPPSTVLLPRTAAPIEGTSKCALLFFGLARSFKAFVLESIQKHLLQVNPFCDVYVHTYDILSEDGKPVNAKDVELLGPNTKVAYDTMESFSKKHNVTFYHQFFPPPIFHWKYASSMDNMIKQWHSIQSAWELMEASGIKYDQVGLFRLDVLYLDDIDLYSGDAVVPSWAWNGGMNDRMFYGNYKYSKVWATEKFSQAVPFTKVFKGILHSERYAKWLMRDVPVTRSTVCFQRVRSTGNIRRDDCRSVTLPPTSPEPKCALLFFGLARSFKDIVLPSIREQILTVNPNCDVYAHTFDIKSENGALVKAQDVQLLGADAQVVMDTEASFEEVRDVKMYHKYFPKKLVTKWTFPTSIDNMLKQWHSIESVWKLMAASGIQYDQVGLFRLDVKYMDPIDISNGVAVVPQWGWSPGMMNDRMFYGRRVYAEVWATGRFELVNKFTGLFKQQLYSESFVKYIMRHEPMTKTNACFRRVSAAGEISVDDCQPGVVTLLPSA